MTELLDARGVVIEPGDTALYPYTYGRSACVAEAVVLGGPSLAKSPDAAPGERFEESLIPTTKVSLTPSGRVRLRVVRRSYGSGEKPVVDVAPDRLVVLKEVDGPLQPTAPDPCLALPSSPLPTQAEKVRKEIEERIKSYTKDLRSDTITWGVSSFADLADFHLYAGAQLAKLRKKLRDLDG